MLSPALLYLVMVWVAAVPRVYGSILSTEDGGLSLLSQILSKSGPRLREFSIGVELSEPTDGFTGGKGPSHAEIPISAPVNIPSVGQRHHSGDRRGKKTVKKASTNPRAILRRHSSSSSSYSTSSDAKDPQYPKETKLGKKETPVEDTLAALESLDWSPEQSDSFEVHQLKAIEAQRRAKAAASGKRPLTPPSKELLREKKAEELRRHESHSRTSGLDVFSNDDQDFSQATKAKQLSFLGEDSMLLSPDNFDLDGDEEYEGSCDENLDETEFGTKYNDAGRNDGKGEIAEPSTNESDNILFPMDNLDLSGEWERQSKLTLPKKRSSKPKGSRHVTWEGSF